MRDLFEAKHPSIEYFDAVVERISPFIELTPLLKSEQLNDLLQCNLFVKAECLQRTGSFKIRGVWNKVILAIKNSLPSHLVTWSSGNHGAALAEVGRYLGIPATVVVPPWIPDIKIDNIRARKGNVRVASANENIASLGNRIALELNAMLIHAYDDAAVIEGQATVTSELLSQFAIRNNGAAPDVILYPCGGGSLIAGAALTVGQCSPIALMGVEPMSAADTKISLSKDEVCEDPNARATICDALRNSRPGSLTFEIMKQSVRDVLLVSDSEVEVAMRMLFEHFKLVAEPGGAIALAAVLSNPQRFRGMNVTAIVSGGNVSPAVYLSAMQANKMSASRTLTAR